MCVLMLSSHLLLMKLRSLFLRGGASSWPFCSHAAIFVQGSAGAVIPSLKAFGPDTFLMIGAWGEIFGF